MAESSKKANKWLIWLIVLMLSVATIISIVNLMRYNQNRNEAIRLAIQRKELEYRVDKLKYRLNSPIDDAYVERIAREKLGLYFPDEIIYFNDIN